MHGDDQDRRRQIVQSAGDLIKEASLRDLLSFLTPELIAANGGRDDDEPAPKEAVVRRAFAHPSAPSRFDRERLLHRLLEATPRVGPFRAVRQAAANDDGSYDFVTLSALGGMSTMNDDPVFTGWRALLLLALAVADTDEPARAMLHRVHAQLREDLREVRRTYLPDESSLSAGIAVEQLAGAVWGTNALPTGAGWVREVDSTKPVAPDNELVTSSRLAVSGWLVQGLCPEVHRPGAPIAGTPGPWDDPMLAAVLATLGRAVIGDDLLAFVGPSSIARRAGPDRPVSRYMVTSDFGVEGRKNALDRAALFEEVLRDDARDPQRLWFLRNASHNRIPYEFHLARMEEDMRAAFHRGFRDRLEAALGVATLELASLSGLVLGRAGLVREEGPLDDWQRRMLWQLTAGPETGATPEAPPSRDDAPDADGEPVTLEDLMTRTFGESAVRTREQQWEVPIAALSGRPAFFTPGRAGTHDIVRIAVTVLYEVGEELMAGPELLGLQSSFALSRLIVSEGALVLDLPLFLRRLDPERLNWCFSYLVHTLLQVQEALPRGAAEAG
jgi:hypothetical protein